mmetsp:Transcript_25782/g.72444  ORF Transcript_25782/g.72444 Transcript_25782/m.72444 type:complete len:80 (+) Transcript_25782:210-449(+)
MFTLKGFTSRRRCPRPARADHRAAAPWPLRPRPRLDAAAQGAARAGPEVRMSLALLLNCYAEAFRMQRENPDNLSGRGI